MNKKTGYLFVNIIFNNIKIVFLLFLFLVAFGAASLASMQRQGFPEVLVNVASVSVVYPNASAEQVEDQIIEPLEAAISDLEDVTEYQSTIGDSWGSVVVTFDQKADLDQAFADLKNEVSGVELPEDAKEPRVEKFSASGSAFVVAVSGYEDSQALYEAGENLKNELQSIEGVKEVDATNELTPEIIIVFDQDALTEHGLTRAQAEELLKTSQLSLPVGSYESDDEEVSIILEKNLSTLDELKAFLLAENVTLADVADVTTRLNNNGNYNRIGYRTNDNYNQDLTIERALLYSVLIDDTADILTVADLIDEKTDELNENASELTIDGNEPTYLTVYSQADSTRQQLDEITQSVFGGELESFGSLSFLGYLLGGLVLVVILLFVFMNLRVAIMAALAIPLSLFFTAIYLSLSGIALNTLVLFSMVLTIGLVVDPTIVFLESMQRFRQKGLSGREAAMETVRTVGLGVFLAVSTNILVFVPFGVVSGFFGEIISYIPATVIPAMVASMLIPVLFFMPVASKILSKKSKDVQGIDDELVGTWKVSRGLGKLIGWILGPGALKVGLRFLIFLVGISLPFIVGYSLINAGTVEVVQFAEQEDSDFILVNADLSEEWTFNKAVDEVALPVQDVLAGIPEIKNFSYFAQYGNSFTMLVTLHPIAERAEKDLRISDDVVIEINREIEKLNLDATIEASTSSEGPPQDEYPVRIRVYSDDADALKRTAADISAYLEDTEGIDVVEDNISQGSSGGTVTFVLDNNNLLTQSPFYVYSIWNERIAENELGTLELDEQSYDVLTLMSPEVTSEETLTSIRITPTREEIAYQQALAEILAWNEANPEEPRDPNVELVKPAPLYVEDLIAEKTIRESETITRINGDRYVEVYASVDDDADALAIQEDLNEYLNAEKIEELGLPEDAIDAKGSADSIEQSFTDLFIALGIAIFLIYVLLVAFFRSYLEPFIILFAIPLGLVGVFGAVAATTGQLGFLELLGVVAMAGIVVNVTILLIDYANQLQRAGKSPSEAIATSIAVRFRPIVLTQLTAFGSLIPLVYLSPFWKGLAAAIIFGIISSALLSMFVTPILYLWANTITRNVTRAPKFLKRFHIAFKQAK